MLPAPDYEYNKRTKYDLKNPFEKVMMDCKCCPLIKEIYTSLGLLVALRKPEKGIRIKRYTHKA